MSTRSGKRIHTSLLEGTATTEQEPAVKSEKKTRSKRVKENFDELSVSIIKNKKRKNYVSYPTDGELLRDVATKQEGETKPNRVLRKNALKDHNPGEISEKVEPQIEAKSFIRKSRRYKKEDDLEETENHENVPVEVIAVPKSKKNKKKKKVESVIDNPREEAPAKKSKKKKKGKRTSSTIEDAQQNTNSKSDVFNRSATSIDSFHSAAGSPSKNEYTIVPDHVNNTLGKTEENSCLKPVTEEMTLEKSSISMAKENLQKGVEDILNMSHLSNEEPRRRKSNTRNATFDKNNTSDNVDVEMQTNLTASIVNNGQVNRGKSNKKEKEVSLYANMEDVDEVINNDTFDKDLRRHFVVKDDTFNKSNASITKETVDYNVDGNVSNISNRLLKTRISVIKDSTFDNSNASIAKEVVNDKMNVSNISNKHVKTRRSTMKNSTFDKSDASIVKENIVEVDLNVSRKQSTRKSGLKDLTFDKSNVSLTNVNNILEDTKPDLNVSNISNKHLKRKKSNVKDLTFNKQESVLNTTFEKETVNNQQAITDSTINQSQHLDSTYEKEQPTVNTTYDKPNKVEETTFEKDISYSFDAFKKGAMSRKSSIRDASFDKCSISIASLSNEDFVKDNNIISSSATKRKTTRHIFDRNETISESAGNTTYEKMENTNNYELKRKSPRLSKTPDIQTILNTTFEKESPNEGKENLISSSKTSLISSDNSSVTDKYDISHISITSDDNSEHLEKIVNITPVLIESSVDESHVCDTKPESPKPQTALKREGTFTKDVPEDPTESELKTPTKSKSTPTAGNTPYHVSNNSKKKSIMNVTRSLEKSLHATVDPAPRLTRVMFCSPVDSPAMFTQEKKKIIKSNLKGSNKSFVFDENASVTRPGRKRSYTQNDADDSRVKRTRLTEDLQQSVDRLSRPRTSSATGKLAVTTPKKLPTPNKPKSNSKSLRTKLPNFTALHQKQFDKMESLNECQERRAKRAKQLLTPTAPPGLLERISPKNNTESPKKSKELAKPKEKTDTPTKKLPTLESLRPGFTRFGFKLNLDVNPFSFPSKTVEKPKEKPVTKPNGPKQGILPSLAGATSVRREAAKQTVMREKSFTDKRNVKRKENRTVIKGVRTNRRFELQMQMRNIE